jgi:hypothetical protein
MSNAMMEAKELKNTDTLNNSDRCDRCGGQAFFWINGVSGDLFFCRHHFLKYEESIRAYAFEITDESHKLEYKIDSSA